MHRLLSAREAVVLPEHDRYNLKGLAQAKIIKKSVILSRVLNMTI